ncbi:MAG: hypothetical protein ABIP03_01215 [Aquihabitans sp.]
MAELSLDTITATVRDALYVGVGAGVIAFQKLQVQRVELTKTLNSQLDDAKGTAEKSFDAAKGSFEAVSELVEDRMKLVEERLAVVEDRLETVLAQIEVKLPEQARDLVKQARELVGLAA